MSSCFDQGALSEFPSDVDLSTITTVVLVIVLFCGGKMLSSLRLSPMPSSWTFADFDVIWLAVTEFWNLELRTWWEAKVCREWLLVLLLLLPDPYTQEDFSRIRLNSGFRQGRHAAIIPVLHSVLVLTVSLSNYLGLEYTHTIQIVRLAESQRKSPVFP